MPNPLLVSGGTNYHSATTLGPRQVSILLFLNSIPDGVARGSDVRAFFDLQASHMHCLAIALDSKGLISIRGCRSSKGNVWKWSYLALTERGKSLAERCKGARIPELSGLVVAWRSAA